MSVSPTVGSIGTFGLTVAGGVFFGPVGAAAGALLGSFLFGSGGPDIEGPRLGDLNVSSSTYGGVIPIGWGVQKVAGTMIWATDIIEERHEREEGGGLIGSGQTVIEYKYFANFAVAFGEGEAADVSRIWAGEQLLVDRTVPLDLEEGSGLAGLGKYIAAKNLKYRIYKGTEDQEPDPLLVAVAADPESGGAFSGGQFVSVVAKLVKQVGEQIGEPHAVPGHRGLVYIVFEKLPLERFGNRIPPVVAEINWAGEIEKPEFKADFIDGGGKFGSTSYQSSGVLPVDWRRGYFYLRTSSPSGIRRFRTIDGKEDLQRLTTEQNPLGSFDEGAVVPLCVDHAGNVYGDASGASNREPIYKLDADSLVKVAQFGSGGTFTGNETFVFENLASAAITYAWIPGGREEFMLTRGEQNAIGILRCRDLSYIWGASQGTLNSRVAGVIGGRSGIGHCEGWWTGTNVGSMVSMSIVHVGIIATASYDLFDSGEEVGVTRTDFTVTPAEIEGGASLFGAGGNIAYDVDDDCLIFAVTTDTGNTYWVKFNKDAGIIWILQMPFSGASVPYGARIEGGRIQVHATSGGRTFAVDLAAGEIVQNETGWSRSASSAGQANDPARGMIVSMDTDGPNIIFPDRVSTETVALSTIVTDLCERHGLDASDLDVSELTDEVRGFALARQVSARGALELLAAAYLFDSAESDWQLKFRKRGRAVSRTLVESELAPLNSDGELFEESRIQEVDLPVRFSVRYQDVDRDADIGLQIAQRIASPAPAMFSQNEATFDVPLTLTATEAKEIALRQIYSAWLERTSHKWRTSWEHVDLEPCDVIQIALDDGTAFTVRLLKCEIGANLELEWETVLEEASSYTVTAVTDGGLSYRRALFPVSTDTQLLLFDTPLLDDVHDTGRLTTGLYWAVGGYGAPGWPGAVLFRSPDGVIWAAADTLLSEVAWGTVDTPPGDTDLPFQTDTASELVVQMVTRPDQVTSVTEAQMLIGYNRAALIRADGSAEIIHFQTAEADANNPRRLTLTTLLRGRRGTETVVNDHAAGELFVLLEDDRFGRHALELSQLDTDIYFRAVGRGSHLSEAPTKQIVFVGRDLMPYAPAHLEGSASYGSSIIFTWVRRTRVGGALQDGAGGVPVSEDAEEYEVDVLDADGTVVRTVTDLTSPTWTYTTAMQDEDFPNVASIKVYQISAQVGRGFAAELAIEGAPVLETIGEVVAEGLPAVGASGFEVDQPLAQRYTTVLGGDVLSLSAYLGGGDADNMRMALYADDAGVPGALLGITEERAVTSTASGHWEEFALTAPLALAAATNYWVAAHTTGGQPGSRGSNANSGQRLISRAYVDGFPDPFGASSSYSNDRGMRIRIWTNPT